MDAALDTNQLEKSKSKIGLFMNFRLIPRIETFPSVVLFTQTNIGKCVILAAFGFCLFFQIGVSLFSIQVLQFLAITSFLPKYRRLILGLYPLWILGVQTYFSHSQFVSISLIVILIGFLLFLFARRWPKSLFGRRPVLFLLVGFSLLIVCGCLTTKFGFVSNLIWKMVSAFAPFLWFIGYALMDRSANIKADSSLEIASLYPLWGSTYIPFPKGAAYLRRIEAQDSKQLAVVQLKGLKLLIWVSLLKIVFYCWCGFFHEYLKLPTANVALAMSVKGSFLPWHICWASQILAFFESIFSVALLGHTIIACCRMSGFNALRNTYRPLASRTLIEFYNRYYYYFKELLVDFFFFPTFFRYGKSNRKLRIVLATFASAGFGNAFFHFTRDWTIMRDLGFLQALANIQSYLLFCFVLATGLCFSQFRKHDLKHKGKGWIRGDFLPILGVMMFYCLLGVFDITRGNVQLVDRLRFFANLFFIHF